MSSAKRPRPLEGARARLRRPHAHWSALRVLVLAVLVVMGAAWALVHHYSFTPPPMLVPIQPTPAPTYDIDAGELPVPETIEPDAS